MTAKITNNFNSFVAKAVRDNLKDIEQALPDNQDINEVPPHY